MIAVSNGRPSPAPNWSQLVTDINLYLSSVPSTEIDGPSELLQRVQRDWSDNEALEVFDAFSGKKRKGLQKSGIKNLLLYIEAAQDDYTQSLLSRILELILRLSSSEKSRKTKKEKAIVKADCVSVLCRAIRYRIIRTSVYAPNQVDASLMRSLVAIGEKDSKFNLKVRLSDLLPNVAKVFCDTCLPADHIFFDLLLKCTRSARNAQSIARVAGVMDTLTQRVAANQKPTTLVAMKNLEVYLQLVFMLAKIRKPRIQLINEKTSTQMLNIVSEQLTSTDGLVKKVGAFFGAEQIEDKKRLTVAYTALGVLRVLANNKRARDEMTANSLFTIAEKELKMYRESPDESRGTVLDSLCVLCMRCMPSLPYPLENVIFPLSFPLPKPLGTPNAKKSFFETSFEELRSSDDDVGEEDEDMFADDITAATGNGRHLFVTSDDEDSKDAPSLPIPKTTKQTTAQLAKYEAFFIELRRGCAMANETSTEKPETSEEIWQRVATRTRHVLPFAEGPSTQSPKTFTSTSSRKDPLLKGSSTIRKTVLDELEKMRSASKIDPKVVYDLDNLLVESTPVVEKDMTSLTFESRFESGNLRRATKVGATHYELILMPDINQKADHTQWFHFQVSNMERDVPYTFEIINCQKTTSMFGMGMQPVMYSQKDAQGWKRVGKNVSYYRNLYSDTTQIDEKSGEEKRRRNYFSLRFEVSFDHQGDTCYIAYHFPYTYTFLNYTLANLRLTQPMIVYCREDIIGSSLAGNPIKMLTITAPGTAQEVASRPVVVLSARVHPGESNASWIMHGILEELQSGMSPEARRLRDQFVFKVIPMLNIDGVVNGSHRCSMAGVDLNRTWDKPNESLHPEVYHSKAIIQYLCEVVGKKPYVYVDLHGHSKKFNCFLFGNNPSESWRKEDRLENGSEAHMTLPLAMKKECPAFSLDQSEFVISRPKESSARVNLWRQFGVETAYTLESTYSAFNAASGMQITVNDLKNIGKQLLKAILEMENTHPEMEKSTED